MCHSTCILFGAINLTKDEIQGKKVLEVGSYNVNGGLRPLIESWYPSEYWGVDIVEGPGVDLVCPAENLINEFGKESFDLVISTEMLEHVKDWKTVINNLKCVCKKGGLLILTTRSYGYPYHPSPTDFWRFEKSDMRLIFSDFEILKIEDDIEFPGVFVKLKKPDSFSISNYNGLNLYNIITDKRQEKFDKNDFKRFTYIRRTLSRKLYKFIIKIIKLFIGSQ